VKAAIVILNFNGLIHLQSYLSNVITKTPEDCQLIIADNGSTDGSIEWLQQVYPQIEIIRLSENYGYASGYNKALSQIDAKYFVLLNSDVSVNSDWLSPIIEKMDGDNKIGAVQPKILSLNNPDEFEHAGAAGGWIDILGYPFCRGRILNIVEKDLGQYDTEAEIFWASGAAMVLRREAFIAAGGFDDSFFAHMEEIDLCYRIKRLGFKIVYVPHSAVYHLGGGALPYESPQKIYLNFRNNLLLILKNSSVFKLMWILPTRMILDGIAAFVYLIKGKPDFFKSIFRAHVGFYKLFGNALKLRKQFKEKAKFTSNLTGLLKGSILIHFYLLGNKHFYAVYLSIKSKRI
jgi:GT2 family glycosyltransferase